MKHSLEKTPYQSAVSSWIKFERRLKNYCESNKIDFAIYEVIFEDIFGVADFNKTYLNQLNQFFNKPSSILLYDLLVGQKFYSSSIQEHEELFAILNKIN